MSSAVSDQSARSDRLDIARLFRSDALSPKSDRSDRSAETLPAEVADGPTGPTNASPCRTGKISEKQDGPTGPTGPTLIDGPAVGADGCLDRFCEQAAVLEFDEGLPRTEAEAVAAQAQGFETPTALHQAAVREWLARLDALERREGRRQIDNARAFTAEGWAAQALALGWDELALFGLCPQAPWQRLDRMGAAWLGSVRAVTADAIIYSTGNRLLRGQQALGAALVWETLHEG